MFFAFFSVNLAREGSCLSLILFYSYRFIHFLSLWGTGFSNFAGVRMGSLSLSLSMLSAPMMLDRCNHMAIYILYPRRRFRQSSPTETFQSNFRTNFRSSFWSKFRPKFRLNFRSNLQRGHGGPFVVVILSYHQTISSYHTITVLLRQSSHSKNCKSVSAKKSTKKWKPTFYPLCQI